jgi:hypothetical protein
LDDAIISKAAIGRLKDIEVLPERHELARKAA